MRIAVLGAGNVGGNIGSKWVAAGHDVVFGVRDPNSPKTRALLDRIQGKARTDSIANAIAHAEVVLFAIPGPAMDDAVRTLGGSLNGKTVIDATNNMGGPAMDHVEALAKQAPQARVYRAFNSLGAENFANPVYKGVPGDLFYCGPEAGCDVMDRLISDVGFRPMYVGGLDQVPTVDGMLSLWFQLARGRGLGRHMAFKVLAD